MYYCFSSFSPDPPKGGHDSDDESLLRKAGGDSDEDESIASGFTELPTEINKKKAAATIAMPEKKKVVENETLLMQGLVVVTVVAFSLFVSGYIHYV